MAANPPPADRPRIVLLHATPIAMAPVQTAFAETWPEAEVVNLLDDGLTIDRAKETDISPAMMQRFVDFGQYGYRMGATGILVTCSAFGPAIDRLAASVPVPVLKPNEAMFQTALASGKTIGMLATFGPSVSTMTDEFEEYVAQAGVKATLTTIVVKDAIDLLRGGTPTRTTGWWQNAPRNSRIAMRSCWRISPPPGQPRRCGRASACRS